MNIESPANRKSPIPAWKFWGFLFVLMALINWEYPGTNPQSRLASIASMSQQYTFQIDGYDHDIDWSRTPDGRTFSNKAPGPALAGFPMTWIWDRVKLWIPGSTLIDPERRSRGYHFLLSFLHQVLPCALIGFFLQQFLRRRRVSDRAQEWAMIAYYFGSTASILANTYFGHSFSAYFLCAGVLAIEAGAWGWAGFALGWCLLSDYSLVYVLPALIFFLWGRKPKVMRILAGSLIPAILWIWYHTSCFGSPWSLPYAFQNPKFLTPPTTQGIQIWGQISLFFDPVIFFKLLVGGERGLLWTQPWILFCLIACAFFPSVLGREDRRWRWFSVLGLGALLWMNASFNGWHGGHCPGPRYLSVIFFTYAAVLGLVWDRLSRGMRWLAILTLVYTLVFRFLVYAHGVIAPPDENILFYYVKEGILSGLSEREHPSWRPLITFLLSAAFFGFLLKKRLAAPLELQHARTPSRKQHQ